MTNYLDVLWGSAYASVNHTPQNVMPDQPKRPPGWTKLTPHQKLAWRKENETNSTGYIGAKRETSGRFSAKIFNPITEENIYLGTFDTAKDAGAAYEIEFLKIYGDEADHDDEEGDEDDDPDGLEDLQDYTDRWKNDTFAGYTEEQMARFSAEILPLLEDTTDHESH